MARRGAWHRLMESTEGPTVSLSLPREWAEELLRSLMASLEMEGGLDDAMDDEDDLDGMHPEPDLDDIGGPPDGDSDDADMDDMDLGMDEPDLAAGDDSDDDDEPAPPKKRGPGRPPKKKDDSDDDDEDDDSDDDEKDETVDFSRGPTDGFRAGTALGESAFARAGRVIGERHVGFKKLKGQLSHQKGVSNPGGLAAAIGRKKYGRAGMAAKSAAGRRK